MVIITPTYYVNFLLYLYSVHVSSPSPNKQTKLGHTSSHGVVSGQGKARKGIDRSIRTWLWNRPPHSCAERSIMRAAIHAIHATAMRLPCEPCPMCPPPHGATQICDRRRRRRGRMAVVPLAGFGRGVACACLSRGGWTHGTYSMCCGISGLGWGLPFWYLLGSGWYIIVIALLLLGLFLFLGLAGWGMDIGGVVVVVCVQFGDSWLGGEGRGGVGWWAADGDDESVVNVACDRIQVHDMARTSWGAGRVIVVLC